MKVGIELQPCLKNKSGIGIYTYELMKRLQEHKEIELCGDVFNFMNRNNIEPDLSGLHFKMQVCKVFPYGVYRRIWNYVPIPYRILFNREVEITHFFNFIVPPRIKGKVINTIHDMTYILYPETMDQRNLKRIKDDIQYSVDRSDRIITVSESSKRDIIKYLGVEEEKIKIIYPGVDYEKFSRYPTAAEIKGVKEKYNLPDEYVLYMGTLEPRKNIPSIIEAFYQLKQQDDPQVQALKLVLAGKKGWLFESIFKKVQELGIEDDVVFTDYVAEEDKTVIYNQARIFVFPSLYEGFGIPVLEAMAASIPVITSNVSSLPEVAGNAGILVEPMDVSAIAQGMYKLLKDKGYCKEIVKKGHEQAEKFNWNKSADSLINIYLDLMQEK